MRKNKIHISDLILYKKSAEEILFFLKENQIKNLEFFIEPLDQEYTKKMLYILEHYKLESLSFHGPFRKCDLAVFTEEGWGKVLYSYEESFKIAQKYHPTFMVLHTNEGVGKDFITEDSKKRIQERVDFIVKLGEKYGIDVVVENVGIGKNMIFSQEEYERMILIGEYKSLIDIGHAYLNHWNIESLIEKLQHQILGFHFHNNDGEYDRHDPIFCGNIRYEEIVPYIQKYTPNAIIVLEYDFLNQEGVVIEDYTKLQKLLEN